jgi:uncharacterized protein
MENSDGPPEWASGLGLTAHPEGGYFAETWRSERTIPAAALPAEYEGDRSAATGIYFLLDRGQRSRWHLVRSDEMWLWHRGGPLTLLMGGTGERPGEVTEVRLGPHLEDGERPQLLIPAGHWQATAPAAEAVLVSCVVAPGFDFADFTLLD